MKAQFHMAGDLDVLVTPDETNRHVRLQIIRGVCYEVGHPSHALPPEGEAVTEPLVGCPERSVDSLVFSRAEARAVASALMGCAAEL